MGLADPDPGHTAAACGRSTAEPPGGGAFRCRLFKSAGLARWDALFRARVVRPFVRPFVRHEPPDRTPTPDSRVPVVSGFFRFLPEIVSASLDESPHWYRLFPAAADIFRLYQFVPVNSYRLFPALSGLFRFLPGRTR
jgi:hypothetical protein